MPFWTPREEELLRKRAEQGFSRSMIARDLGRSISSIQHRLSKLKIKTLGLIVMKRHAPQRSRKPPAFDRSVGWPVVEHKGMEAELYGGRRYNRRNEPTRL